MRILVLYTRLTGYFYSCMQYDVNKNSNIYLVIKKSPTPDAPYTFKPTVGIEMIDGDGLSEQAILKQASDFSPDLIYITGWTDNRFLKIARVYKKKGTSIIMGMDNQWKANLRQNLASLLSTFLVKRYFTHAWIPGMLQYEFARRLGFKAENILTNLYSCDLEKFSYSGSTSNKRFLFIGRLVHHKGIDILLEAFDKLQKTTQTDWGLHIIGNGEYENVLKGKDGITYSSFLQPDYLHAEFHKGGVFVLPSRYEAWGVVIHEAAAASLPIITTTSCGAARHLVFNNYNGYTIPPANVESLYKAMKTVIQLDNEKLVQMGKNSYQQAMSINIDIWQGQLNSIRINGAD